MTISILCAQVAKKKKIVFLREIYTKIFTSVLYWKRSHLFIDEIKREALAAASLCTCSFGDVYKYTMESSELLRVNR
jgi:hypothetical protein